MFVIETFFIDSKQFRITSLCATIFIYESAYISFLLNTQLSIKEVSLCFKMILLSCCNSQRQVQKNRKYNQPVHIRKFNSKNFKIYINQSLLCLLFFNFSYIFINLQSSFILSCTIIFYRFSSLQSIFRIYNNKIQFLNHSYSISQLHQPPQMIILPKYDMDIQEKARKKTGQEVYFQGNKKNQLNDLKKYFKTILYAQDKAEVRQQIIKRIINQTTRGVDTSRLFPQMVLASSTKDLVEKKMIYLYLINYSKQNQNFARMAINTFLKDATSQNPNIRALSLRHLSNLRFKGRDQYVLPLLKKGLYDFSSIVKKSSIMGLTKIITQKNRLSQYPERQQEILNTLYTLIRDPDSGVVCCALQAINQIQPEGLIINKKLATYLMDNLSTFSQYQLPTVLKYLQLYEPKSEQQTVNIMNTLYSKIRSSVLSVTLGISKIYLRYAELYPQHLQNIIGRLKKPLMSFLNNDNPEIQYVALKHIQYLISKYKLSIFVNDIKKFFVNFNEKSYLKLAKMRIIELNINQYNFIDTVNQLGQYISDEQISKQAINTLQRLMMKAKQQKNSKFILKTVVKVIQTTWNDYLCNNALPMIRNFLRKFSNQFLLIADIFYTLVSKATEKQAKCSIIEIIGQFGQFIQDAIELIQWNSNQKSDAVKISLLRANVKLFLKRPLQMLNMVTSMFNKVLNDDQEQLYVKDYAAFLYRGLEKDIQGFKKLYLQTRQRQQLVQAQTPNLQINSLQIVYQKQQYKWIIQKDKFLDQIEQQLQYQNQYNEQGTELSQEQVYRKTSEDIKNNINLDSIYRKLQAEDFDNQFQMDEEQFEKKWEQYQVGSSITRIVKNLDMIHEDNLEELFKIWNIGVMASAEDEDMIKLYLYCKIKNQQKMDITLLEFQITKITQTMTLMIKSQDEQLSGFISKYIEEFLKLNQII